jgi:hypothetical protein
MLDHIVPLMREGTDKLDNLAWACFECNVMKGTNVASYENHVLTPLFNPRGDRRGDHFDMINGVITGKSAVGRVTVRVLDMNALERVEVRQRLTRAGQ